MTRRIQILAGAALLVGFYGAAQVGTNEGSARKPAPARQSPPPEPFAVANVHFEQNASDGDFEVVFEAKCGHEGLAKLTVVSPDGRTVVDFTAPDASTLGMRQFRFESPEPSEVKSLKAAYPEGVYTFAGTTASGEKLNSQATLNHKLPATASLLQPRPHSQDVDVKNLEITWTPVKNLAAYIISIEQDELNVSLTAKLPAAAAKLAVPDGFLLPDMQYTIAIGTVTEEDNTSFVETWFTTAGKE